MTHIVRGEQNQSVSLAFSLSIFDVVVYLVPDARNVKRLNA